MCLNYASVCGVSSEGKRVKTKQLLLKQPHYINRGFSFTFLLECIFVYCIYHVLDEFKTVLSFF